MSVPGWSIGDTIKGFYYGPIFGVMKGCQVFGGIDWRYSTPNRGANTEPDTRKGCLLKGVGGVMVPLTGVKTPFSGVI